MLVALGCKPRKLRGSDICSVSQGCRSAGALIIFPSISTNISHLAVLRKRGMPVRKCRQFKGCLFIDSLMTFNMVRTRRIELPLPRGNRLLRPARLPVPPRPHLGEH